MMRFGLLWVLLAGVVAGEKETLVIPATSAASVVKLFEQKESWVPGDPKAWQWIEEEGTTVLRLSKQSEVKPEVRSPVNLTWFKAKRWSSFQLEAELRLTKFDESNNDLCVAFCGEDATRFYYVHLGDKADLAHHQIHLVDRADRKPVTIWRTDGTPWKAKDWHKVRVVRRGETGELAVFFDGKLVMTARDKTIPGGMIGLGSFDDTGDFRNLEIRGVPLVEEK